MTNLINIKGVGNKSLKLLNSINIYNVEDLLSYYPYKYNFIKLSNIDNIQDKTDVIITCVVQNIPVIRRFNTKMNSMSFNVIQNNRLINIVIFNRVFMFRYLKPGIEITVFGKYDLTKNKIVASDIKLGKIIDNSIESIYHLVSGISKNNINKYIDEALKLNIKLDDYVPDYLNNKYSFIDKNIAIKYIHRPKNINEIKQAKLKLIYEELFVFMFKINYLKINNFSNSKNINRNIDYKMVENFIDKLPFKLTNDQELCVKEIFNDLTSNKRMNRMIQGDVGSGKTVIAIIACYINYLSGYQSAFMAPTEILAEQHYNNILSLMKGLNINVRLLIGSTKKKEKNEIYFDLKSNKIDLIIGTHALLSENVEFEKLGLVITDEQHRFGVNQRKALRNKGKLVDTLYMSATPIPRTFALTLYGDMDISYIKQKPGNRKDIETIIKTEMEIKDVLMLMRDEIIKGHQIYVICPLIEEGENINLNTVIDIKRKMDIAFNNKINISVLHGKLLKKEKEQIMNDFKLGKIKVLISTTVVEVGVDVKNATMMVIFNAERFGLATLHQLRGRIGRNDYDCKCVLIGNNDKERLKILSESNDGFYITEKDYELRGEGDIFGIKQSGSNIFKIADVKRDLKILMKAKEDSEDFIKKFILSDFDTYPLYGIICKEILKLD